MPAAMIDWRVRKVVSTLSARNALSLAAGYSHASADLQFSLSRLYPGKQPSGFNYHDGI